MPGSARILFGPLPPRWHSPGKAAIHPVRSAALSDGGWEAFGGLDELVPILLTGNGTDRSRGYPTVTKLKPTNRTSAESYFSSLEV